MSGSATMFLNPSLQTKSTDDCAAGRIDRDISASTAPIASVYLLLITDRSSVRLPTWLNTVNERYRLVATVIVLS